MKVCNAIANFVPAILLIIFLVVSELIVPLAKLASNNVLNDASERTIRDKSHN